MTIEVLRVDPASRVAVGEPWLGYGLRSEQRHPVSGEGFQLWSISRATSSPASAILEGMPLGPALPNVDSFAMWLTLAAQRRLVGGELSLAEAYVFALLVQRAESSTLVDGVWTMGVRGAVAGMQWWRDRLRAEGKV